MSLFALQWTPGWVEWDQSWKVRKKQTNKITKKQTKKQPKWIKVKNSGRIREQTKKMNS